MNWQTQVYNALKTKGLRLDFLASALGVSNQRIYNLMQQNDIKFSTLQKIAEVLDISLSQLLNTEEHTTICPHCKKPIKISINLE